mmetsp:Transcript_130181/g.324598  ORF Transcript_130181/g.324598 Transcript_130181/m.324598 type:complete len:515 (+) Transcript_130181:139-1683(+)
MPSLFSRGGTGAAADAGAGATVVEQSAEATVDDPDLPPPEQRDLATAQSAKSAFASSSRHLNSQSTLSLGRRRDGLRGRLSRELKKKAKVHQKQFKTGIGHRFPRVRRIVANLAFDYIVALLIIANCIFIGMQANNALDDAESIVFIVENVFTFCFLTDLVMRVLGYGWTWLFESENYVDTFLVVMSVMVTWILQPAGFNVEDMRKLTVLRTLRLVRIARAVRMRPEFKEMWALLKGLVDSAETLCWTYVMICILLYFFAIMATSLIGKQDAFRDNASVQELFGDVPKSMLTLFQVMTLDSWSSLCRPIMVGSQVWIGVFFIVFITVAQFVLMNLVTAVIVENAFSDSKTEDEELAQRIAREKEKELEELTVIFKQLDEDGSGMLTREELNNASKKRKVRQKLRAIDVLPKDIDELWEILDDGDGELSAEEFVSGLQRLRGEAKAKDILRLYRELRVMEASIREINQSMNVSQGKMHHVKSQLQRAKVDIAAMQRTLARAKEAVKQAAHTQPLN